MFHPRGKRTAGPSGSERLGRLQAHREPGGLGRECHLSLAPVHGGWPQEGATSGPRGRSRAAPSPGPPGQQEADVEASVGVWEACPGPEEAAPGALLGAETTISMACGRARVKWGPTCVLPRETPGRAGARRGTRAGGCGKQLHLQRWTQGGLGCGGAGGACLSPKEELLGCTGGWNDMMIDR